MRTLEISNETYDKIKKHLTKEEQIDLSSYEDMIGNCFFFRTVTYHFVGKVVKRVGDFLELSGASWIADSGRFMQAIQKGELNEVEPLGQWYVNLKACTDFGLWRHALPEEQK